MSAAPRASEQRRRDTEDLLRREIDAWVSTAGPDGPWMVPLSFVWHEERLILGTGATSRTMINLRATPAARVGVGPTRDVVVLDVTAEIVATAALDTAAADAFAAAAGFDPRPLTDYAYAVCTPHRIQAWREENELAGRTLMRGGRWLTTG